MSTHVPAAALSDRIFDATEKTLDPLETCSVRRERQFLSQSLRNHTAAYAGLTAQDVKAASDLTVVVSRFDRLTAGVEAEGAAAWTPRPASSRIDAPHASLELQRPGTP